MTNKEAGDPDGIQVILFGEKREGHILRYVDAVPQTWEQQQPTKQTTTKRRKVKHTSRTHLDDVG